MKILSPLLKILADILLLIGLIWSLGLICHQPYTLLLLIPLGLIALSHILTQVQRNSLLIQKKRYIVRPWLWAVVVNSIIFYLFLPGPQPDAWQSPWAKAPVFEQEEDSLRIKNLRNFRYTDPKTYEIRYSEESYDLNSITGVYFADCYWDNHTDVCHTMLSFSFADGRHLVVSPETRLPALCPEQNAISGLYKQYGLIYLFGKEEDIFALRSNYRHEDIHLYKLKFSPAQAKEMLLDCVQLSRDAEKNKEAYNTVADNCSTGLLSVLSKQIPNRRPSYRLLPLFNGKLVTMLYEQDLIEAPQGENLKEIRSKAYLGYDLAAADLSQYSAAIRQKIGIQENSSAPAPTPATAAPEEEVPAAETAAPQETKPASSAAPATPAPVAAPAQTPSTEKAPILSTEEAISTVGKPDEELVRIPTDDKTQEDDEAEEVDSAEAAAQESDLTQNGAPISLMSPTTDNESAAKTKAQEAKAE